MSSKAALETLLRRRRSVLAGPVPQGPGFRVVVRGVRTPREIARLLRRAERWVRGWHRRDQPMSTTLRQITDAEAQRARAWFGVKEVES